MSKLIYIISMGHSGSTLADMWLGTIPGVFSTGEVIHLPRQIWRGENPADIQTYCSCGKYFNACSFWKRVYSNIQKKTGLDVLQNPEKFDISIHSSFLHNRTKMDALRHRMLLGLYKIGGHTKVWESVNQHYKNSIKNNWLMYDAVAEESGNEYVIDSSKNFLRYIFLKSYRPKDVKLVLLMRNIHGVASSSHHGLSNSIIMERAREWEKLYTRMGRYLQQLNDDEYYVLNYEKMCSDPIGERENIANFIGLNNDLPEGCSFNTKDYHLVAGNPIRHQGVISIRYDERWKKRLTKEQVEVLNQIQDKVYRNFKFNTSAPLKELV